MFWKKIGMIFLNEKYYLKNFLRLLIVSLKKLILANNSIINQILTYSSI
jgi:hypothetical protein